MITMAATGVVDSLEGQILLAAIGVVLGFASALLVDQLKARREPRKQLSWDAVEELGMVSIRPAVRERVKVLYRGHPVSDLFALKCRISNTGNRVVKDHQVRFQFPDNCSVLDAYAEPEPARELQFSELDGEGLSPVERLYHIGHLEKNQEVIFQFILTGPSIHGWAVYSFNAEGDVAFQRRGAATIRQDQAHIRPFLFWLLLLLIVPPIFTGFWFGELGDLAATGAALALLLLLIPHVSPFVRVIAQMIEKYLEPNEPSLPTVQVGGDAKPNFVVAQRFDGRADFYPTPDEET
jgi:hypothetical protein